MSTGAWTEVDRLADPDSDFAEEAVRSASYIMWLLTGRKFGGVRTVTEVYCQPRPQMSARDIELAASRGAWIPAYPDTSGGAIVNVCSNSGCNGCWHTLRLRNTPVVNVSAVSVADRAIPLSDVAIIDSSQIAPMPASGCWGSCGDITVTYQYGAPPPSAGVMAATDLANQFLWAMSDDDRCTLPARVTSISRQGVSWTLIDQQEFLQDGRTGIYSVDLFIKTVNPNGAQRRPRVFSPDLPSGRTRRAATDVRRTPRGF